MTRTVRRFAFLPVQTVEGWTWLRYYVRVDEWTPGEWEPWGAVSDHWEPVERHLEQPRAV